MSRPTKRNARRGVTRFVVRGLAALGVATAAWWFGVERPRRDSRTRAAIDTAQAELRRGRAADALRAVERLSESGTFAAEVLAVKGMVYASYDRPQQARPYLEKSLEIDPRQPMLLKVLAAIRLNDDDMEGGFALLERASELDPSDDRPWYASGHLLLKFQNRPKEAVDLFRGALKRRPNDKDSRIGLAEALLTLGQIDEAAPLVERLSQEFPDDLEVLGLSVSRANLLALPEEVERLSSRLLEKNPNLAEILVLRANSRIRGGRLQDALQDAERAVSIAPRNVPALFLLARVENALDLKDRAAETSRRHSQALAAAELVERRRGEARKRPNDPECRRNLGLAAAEAGMFTLARKSYIAALSIDPGDLAARRGLAALDAASR